MIKKILKFTGICIAFIVLFPIAVVVLGIAGVLFLLGETIYHIWGALRDLWQGC